MNTQILRISCPAAACFMAAVLIFVLCATARAQEASPADLKTIMETIEALKKSNAELARQTQQANQRNEELSRRLQKMEQQINSGTAATAVADASPKIEELNARVKNLEAQGPGETDKTVAGLSEDVKYLTEMVDVVGKKALADKVQIGAELRTRMDWFNYRADSSFPTPDGLSVLGFKIKPQDKKHVSENINAYGTVRMRLNLKAQATENLVFHSRLTMYKSWNDSQTIGSGQYNDSTSSREPSNSDLRVERAYADYYFKIWDKLPMALSFGRLPTTDSLGSDLRENTLRKSTYPALAYDAEGDGIGLSIDMSSVIGLPNAAIRLVYNRINPENDRFVYREDALDLGSYNAYVAQFETGIPGDIWRDTIFVSHLIYVPNFPSLDMSSGGFKPINVTQEWGDYWKQTFFVESRRFLGTRFDVFGGVSFLKSNANSKYSEWSLMGVVRYKQGLLSNEGEETRWGRGFYTGMRYTMPFEWLKEPMLGIEYNYGSRYWLGLNPGSEDPLHKLDRLGSVWDFYYIQPLDTNLFLRLGCTFVKTNYSNYSNLAGKPARHEETINNPYLLLDAKF